MQLASEVRDLQRLLQGRKQSGQSIGFVPTMGAFHEGHLSLMRRAKSENDCTVVSLFVNPSQFNEIEDYEKYPRTLEADRALAESVGVDIFFEPSADEMYPSGFDTVVVVRRLSEMFEGEARPGHFNGVSTVVTKLLLMAGPTRAYFGEKDWQQLQVVNRMVADLNIPCQIIGMPIIRDQDGLALSSRNVRLTPEQRQAALTLSQALDNAEAIAGTGVQDAYQIAAWMRQTIEVNSLAHLEYAVVVDPESLQEVDTIENGAQALVAARFGAVRLIDNRSLRPAPGQAVRR